MKALYMPSTLDEKLGYLIAACGKTLTTVGKTLRWSLDSVNPELSEEKQEMNIRCIIRELKDLKQSIRWKAFQENFMGKKNTFRVL